MKKKILTLLISGIMLTISASSQAIKDNIDKAAKDKSNADKATKADVLIHQKTIYDSAQIKAGSIKQVSQNTAPANKVKYHKYKYKKKTKTSSK